MASRVAVELLLHGLKQITLDDGRVGSRIGSAFVDDQSEIDPVAQLLSFAQFERELTGERIRDKIAASKARGMWMGGTVPLGYDPPAPGSRALVVNAVEAEIVRTIFTTYLELGSVHALKNWLHVRGIHMRTPVQPKPNWQGQPGNVAPAVPKTATDQQEKQSPAKQPSKLDLMTTMVSRPEGASVAELAEATGWQEHSIRGAIAGTLKKKGHSIRSEPVEGGRRYRIGAAG